MLGTVFVGFFQGRKNHGKNQKKKIRPGKNRFWTGFFPPRRKNTLADRVVVATRPKKTPVSHVQRLLMPTWSIVQGVVYGSQFECHYWYMYMTF